MALDTNYVYRYRCSEYGGLICESNFRDFDPITDAWTGTNSADCRAAERMGILVGQRPKCSGGRGRISNKGKDMFSSFMGAELSGNQKIASVATTLIGGFIGYKFIKKDKTLGAAVGLTLGAGLGTIINQYIK